MDKRPEQNSFEGGYAGFWGDDIYSELDDKWAEATRKILAESAKKRAEEEKKGKKSVKDVIKKGNE